MTPARAWTAPATRRRHTGRPSTDECKGPNNLKVKVTGLGLPWRLRPRHPEAGGETIARLVGVRATLHTSDGCDFTVGGPGTAPGEVPVVYTRATNRIVLNGGNLVIKTANAQCDPAVFEVGDRIKIIGTFLRARPGQPARGTGAR